jgi:rhamnulose-1-phosphate aldolase
MIGNIDNLLNFSDDLFTKKELKPVFLQIAGIAQYLWERGWAERNAGNFSINITAYFHEKELDRLTAYPFFSLTGNYPALSRKVFMISGAGTRMRDISRNPAEHVCLVYLSESGSAHLIVNSNQDGTSARPTSELLTHLAIQQQLLQKKATEKVVLHGHVTELIALTQLTPFTSEKEVNNLLWAMHPETLLYLPDGVGFVPYVLAGTEKMAVATLKGFENHKVVLWEKHGCLAVGETMAHAFDHLDILAKSAKIYFQCKSTGMEPAGLTPGEIMEIRHHQAGPH